MCYCAPIAKGPYFSVPYLAMLQCLRLSEWRSGEEGFREWVGASAGEAQNGLAKKGIKKTNKQINKAQQPLKQTHNRIISKSSTHLYNKSQIIF